MRKKAINSRLNGIGKVKVMLGVAIITVTIGGVGATYISVKNYHRQVEIKQQLENRRLTLDKNVKEIDEQLKKFNEEDIKELKDELENIKKYNLELDLEKAEAKLSTLFHSLDIIKENLNKDMNSKKEELLKVDFVGFNQEQINKIEELILEFETLVSDTNYQKYKSKYEEINKSYQGIIQENEEAKKDEELKKQLELEEQMIQEVPIHINEPVNTLNENKEERDYTSSSLSDSNAYIQSESFVNKYETVNVEENTNENNTVDYSTNEGVPDAKLIFSYDYVRVYLDNNQIEVWVNTPANNNAWGRLSTAPLVINAPYTWQSTINIFTCLDASIDWDDSYTVSIVTFDHPDRLMNESYIEIYSVDGILLKSQFINGAAR